MATPRRSTSGAAKKSALSTHARPTAGKGSASKQTCALGSNSSVDERLSDALQRLHFHVQRMPLAHIVWDTDFRVADWNPAAERIFGYKKKEAIGRHPYDLIVPPEVVGQIEQVWADLLAGDVTSHSINANVRKDGTRITCEWFNTPLRDSRGRIHCIASMAQDITERESAEARVRDAQKLEGLAVLASGIAHDFNSSLMVILGNASLLRSIKNMPAKAAEHLELIEQAGFRANQLIKHLLTYARSGRHNPQPTDLNSLLDDCAAFVRTSIGKAHPLLVNSAPALPTISVDRGQVEQVIVNLCLNARQSMPQGGEIQVSTRKVNLSASAIADCVSISVDPGPFVELSVRDFGEGIARDVLPKIFDPFFTTRPEGHGLGLSGVLGILRQHRGTLCVESKVGEGTTFHVYFPVDGGVRKPRG